MMNHTLISQLGKGATSTVFLAFNEKTNDFSALKCIKTTKDSLPNRKALQYAANEVQSLKALDHPNIIKIYSYEKINLNPEDAPEASPQEGIALNLEYLPNGDLHEYIKQGGNFKEKIARFYFKQLIQALEHIHASGFAHRDVKIENLLLDCSFNLKMADFGFSYPLERGQCTSKIGSVPYMSPEVTAAKLHNPIHSDIFAAGVVLFILVGGYFPFQSTDDQNELYQLVRQGKWKEFWKFHDLPNRQGKRVKFSNHFKRLFEKLVESQAEDRASITEIKESSFYKQKTASISDVKSELSKRKKAINTTKLASSDNRKEAKVSEFKCLHCLKLS